MRSTNTSVPSDTTQTDLPKSDNEMACCVIRISASSYTNVTYTVIYVIIVITVSKTGRLSLSKVDVDNADMKSVEAQTTNFICTIAT